MAPKHKGKVQKPTPHELSTTSAVALPQTKATPTKDVVSSLSNDPNQSSLTTVSKSSAEQQTLKKKRPQRKNLLIQLLETETTNDGSETRALIRNLVQAEKQKVVLDNTSVNARAVRKRIPKIKGRALEAFDRLDKKKLRL